MGQRKSFKGISGLSLASSSLGFSTSRGLSQRFGKLLGCAALESMDLEK